MFIINQLNNQIICKNIYSHLCVQAMKDYLKHSNIYKHLKKIHYLLFSGQRISHSSNYYQLFLVSVNWLRKLDRVSDHQMELIKIIMLFILLLEKQTNKFNLLLNMEYQVFNNSQLIQKCQMLENNFQIFLFNFQIMKIKLYKLKVSLANYLKNSKFTSLVQKINMELYALQILVFFITVR